MTSHAKPNWKSMAAAFVTLCVVTLGGVIFFFRPIEQSDSASGALLHPAVGLMVYLGLSVWLFDWAARQLQSAYKAAFIIASSQFVLVNVDFVFRGERGLLTAGASTVLLIVTWVAAAYAYSAFVQEQEK